METNPETDNVIFEFNNLPEPQRNPKFNNPKKIIKFVIEEGIEEIIENDNVKFNNNYVLQKIEKNKKNKMKQIV